MYQPYKISGSYSKWRCHSNLESSHIRHVVMSDYRKLKVWDCGFLQ